MKAHPTAALVLMLAGTALAAEPLTLQALTPTSGTGAELLLDGNPATGWHPEGDPVNEGVLLRLEEPVSFGTIGLQPCPGSPGLQVEVSIDGAPIYPKQTSVAAGKESLFSFPAVKNRSVFVKLLAPAPAQACLGEIRLLSEGKPLSVKAPRLVPGRIQASSVLEPADAYHPSFLFDGRTDFGWAKGAKGTGAGESLTLTLEAPVELVGLELWNGYQRSEDHFRKNARAGQLSLSVDGGAPIVLKVKDASGPQMLKLPAPVKGKTLKLTVDKAIAGTKYPDLVLSELRLVDAQGPLSVRTTDTDARRKAFQAALANTSLGKVVDRSWSKRCETGNGHMTRTFKARTNHTFVFYDQVTGTENDEDYDEVLDGAWVVKKVARPWAAIELYGRRHRVESRSWNPYEEPRDTESTRIGGGTLEIARVADLDEPSFQKLVAEWSNAPQSQAVPCMGKEGNTYKELVAADAILVRGPAVTELLVP